MCFILLNVVTVCDTRNSNVMELPQYPDSSSVILTTPSARADTVLTGFTRNFAPGWRVTRDATAVLNGVTFRDIELLPKSRGTVIEATAVAAYPGATLALIARPTKVEMNPMHPARMSRMLNSLHCTGSSCC